MKVAFFVIVHVVAESWNQLHTWVFEASEAIVGITKGEKVLIP